MVTVTLEIDAGFPHKYSVWIQLESGDPLGTDSFIIGSGDTEQAARAEAITTLYRLTKRLQSKITIPVFER